MPARPAPTITAVSTDGTVELVPHGATSSRSYSIHTSKFDKVTWIKIGSFLGTKWSGVPMHLSLDDIQSAVRAKFAEFSGSPIPTTPTITNPQEEEMPTTITTDPSMPSSVDEALNILRNVLQGQGATEERVRQIVADEIEKVRPKVVEIHMPERPAIRLDGIQHYQFPKVLAHVNMGNHLLMVGSAGTGKSTIAEQVAKALGLAFSSKSVTQQTSEASLLGYMDATGRYITTEFRKRFEEGGVFLLDEVDAGNPNVLGVLNSALANGWMAFPDGMVQRHKDFVAIAAGNTYGNGATAEYVGRNPLDKAFTNRFMTLCIGIDESIEDAMVDAVGLEPAVATKWLRFVRTVRANVEESGLKVIVSPRNTFGGAKMIKSGAFTTEEIIESAILQGAKPEQAEKMLRGASF